MSWKAPASSPTPLRSDSPLPTGSPQRSDLPGPGQVPGPEQAVAEAEGRRLPAGAAPVWDILSGTLLWAAPGDGTVHRLDPATGDVTPLRLPQPVAAAHPRRRGGLVLTLRDGVALLDPDGARRWLVYWAREGVTGTAATVDAAGRLWVATSGDGALLRVEPDGAVAVVLQDVAVSGIAFSPDAATMYLVDAVAGQITAAGLDPGTGHLGPRRPLADVPGGPGGLCVDADGRLWVTSGAEPAVRRYDPEGAPEPAPNLASAASPLSAASALGPVGGAHPTGCTFGGLRLTDLYLTTTPVPAAEPAAPLLVVPDAGAGLPTPVFAG